MNFLAHAQLSFNDPEILVGNMISDFVKGKKKFDYPPRIQQGIYLHRCIDEYTDRHAVTRQAQQYFRAAYRLYSGAFIDVIYDHYLATDENEFNDPLLRSFAQRVYNTLDTYQHWFPERFDRMYPYMRSQDWLYNYRSRQGIYNALGGLVRRAAYLSDSSEAVTIFDEHYEELAGTYRRFWPELKAYAREVYEGL